MGLRICEGDGATFIYSSVTDRALLHEAFPNAEEAEAYIEFAKARGVRDLAACNALDHDALRDDFVKLPRCRECAGRVVNPGEVADECAGCRPGCDWVEGARATCDARGSEAEREPGGAGHALYCPFHAAEVRKARKRAAAKETA